MTARHEPICYHRVIVWIPQPSPARNTMKKLLTIALTASLLLPALALTACKTDKEGVSKNPITGSVYRTVQASPPEVAQATETVLNEMGLYKVKARSTELDAQVTGMTADDTKVTVWAGKGETGTDVYAKYGNWSDPAQAQTILEQISEKLGPMEGDMKDMDDADMIKMPASDGSMKMENRKKQ